MANITKRKDSYLIRASCGYDTQGKQIIKSKTWKPAPGMTERQIEKELNKIAVEFESNVQNGNIAETYRIKFDVFCKEYERTAKTKLSPVTYSYYERIINNRLIPEFGHMKINAIRPPHVQDFILKLCESNTLASSSIHRNFTVLKSIMAKAYKLGYIDSNPTDSTRLDLPPIEQPPIDIFSKEETAHMLDCLEGEPLQYKLLIHLAIVTGCRRGELVALQWDCVDYEHSAIEIRQSNYKIKGEDIQTKTTKTAGSIRTITIPKYCINLLKEYKKEQSKERLLLGSAWNNEDWIFTQWNGKPMHPQTPTLWFSKFQTRHNLPHRKFHALRHTSATLLLTDGTNIKTVASRLGHSKISTTNRYVHSLTSADEAVANTFDEMFSNKKRHNEQIMNKCQKANI